MRTTELRDLDDAKIVDQIATFRKELFGLRFQRPPASWRTPHRCAPRAATWPGRSPSPASAGSTSTRLAERHG
jgi:hypothetical protein